MICRVLTVALCLVGVSLAHTIPSFADNEEYDLVMLAERESMGAVPASSRLSPKLYESAEAARKAAEEELAKLGEEIESIPALEKKAEQEALSVAKDTASDPIHSDLEGIKVNLGHEGDFAMPAPVAAVPKEASTEQNIEVTQPAVDMQNEQYKLQHNEDDVPFAKRGHSNTRPSAPQFGFAGVQSPQMQFPGLPQMPQMQFPGMPQMPQMPQMQFPGMPQIQFPGFPQMQFPGMPHASPVSSLVAPDLEESDETVQQAKSHSKHHEHHAEPQTQNNFMIPQFPSMFPPSVMQQPQMQLPANFFQAQQMPSALQGLPLMPNQMSEMLKQFPQMLQTMPAQTQSQNSAQFPVPEMFAQGMPDITKAIQSVPQMLPQLMQQLPQMMQQMQQSMMMLAPQMMQQMPQVLQQLPAFPFSSLQAKKEELSSTAHIGLEAEHHKSPKVRLAPLTSHKHQAHKKSF